MFNEGFDPVRIALENRSEMLFRFDNESKGLVLYGSFFWDFDEFDEV